MILIGPGVLLLLVAVTYGNLLIAESMQAGRQFAVPWLAAHSWVIKGVSPYDESVGEPLVNNSQDGDAFVIEHLGITIPGERVVIPIEFVSGRDYPQFTYPLISMLVFAPFGLMDFTLARAVWMTTLEICLILLVFASIKLSKWEIGIGKTVVLVFFSMLWYYALTLVLNGQIGVMTALFVTLSLVFLFQNQDILSGIFLALAMINPQMVILLVPFVLLWSFSVRRRDIAWSFLVTLSVLLLGFTIFIPSWLVQWLLRLYEFATTTIPLYSPLITIASNMPGIYGQVIAFLYGVLLIYLLVEWVIAIGKNEQWFLWTALMTIVIGSLAGYRTGTANYMLMLPVLFVIFKAWEDRWQVGGRFLTGIILFILGAGIWAIILAFQQTLEEPVWVYYPLPIIALFGLWWVRWWFIRPPQLLMDKMMKKVG